MTKKEFEPKIISIFRGHYSFKNLSQDVLAGIIVGIVALPLSIAFAIASGVKPEQGIYTAVIAGFLVSCFSGSRVQIGGPTGAFIIIVYEIVQKYGYEGLAVATIMAGVMLIIMGLARMGDVIKYIPYPVTIGFTSGIALIIFTTQIKDFFGLTILNMPEHFIDKWSAYIQNISALNPSALALSILTILIITFWPRITNRIPGTLVAIFATTALMHIFSMNVETIGSRFGEVSSTLPTPRIPHFDLDMLIKLSSPAMTIALLAGIESLLSAVVADGMTGFRHRSNMELVAQGIANIVSPLFQGIPATGAIARTATNIKNGGRSPIAGIVHAVTLLLILLFFGKWAALIPMATLAGILITVAYNMSEWHFFLKILRGPRGDVVVLLLTFFLTVLVSLTVAIEMGVVLAAFLFMHRVVDISQIESVKEDLESEINSETESEFRAALPEDIEIFEINGPFFFGATEKFKDTLREIRRPPKALILLMAKVPNIDSTGIKAMEDILARCEQEKIKLILVGLNSRLHKSFTDMGFFKRFKTKHLFDNLETALEYIKTI